MKVFTRRFFLYLFVNSPREPRPRNDVVVIFLCAEGLSTTSEITNSSDFKMKTVLTLARTALYFYTAQAHSQCTYCYRGHPDRVNQSQRRTEAT